MLQKEHIDFYWEGILRAKRRALDDIETARTFAQEMHCEGCEYCRYILRHEQILGKITADLIVLVDSLREQNYSVSTIFPRHFVHDEMIYRGAIAEDGQYLPFFDEDYKESREKYAQERGKEYAYRLINVIGIGEKAQVVFCDRKAPPSEAQYATLKDLMVDAKGALDFFFVYDPSHPH